MVVSLMVFISAFLVVMGSCLFLIDRKESQQAKKIIERCGQSRVAADQTDIQKWGRSAYFVCLKRFEILLDQAGIFVSAQHFLFFSLCLGIMSFTA